MYRIKMTLEDKSKTLFKSKELGELLARAVNSRAFQVTNNHHLELEEKTAGSWDQVVDSGLEVFTPSAQKKVKA